MSVSGLNSAERGKLLEKQALLAWQSLLKVGTEDRAS